MGLWLWGGDSGGSQEEDRVSGDSHSLRQDGGRKRSQSSKLRTPVTLSGGAAI